MIINGVEYVEKDKAPLSGCKEVGKFSDAHMCKFIGKRITFFCCRYIYAGVLSEIEQDSYLLTDCGIVYETGAFGTPSWKDYQKLPNDFYVSKQAVESFGLLKELVTGI